MMHYTRFKHFNEMYLHTVCSIHQSICLYFYIQFGNRETMSYTQVSVLDLILFINLSVFYLGMVL